MKNVREQIWNQIQIDAWEAIHIVTEYKIRSIIREYLENNIWHPLDLE